MHLNKLALRNFKKYRRAEIDFFDGLTGIVGSNGSGKSTIVEAIAWALYGNRVSSIRREYIRNTHAGASESVEVSLRLNRGRQEMQVTRIMRGKNLAPDAELRLDGRPVARGTRDVDQRLEEILKINYQDFMKTFYARQKDLDNLLKEGGTGKREYLLKLLGLDDIRERALLQIREDANDLKAQENRLRGALAEIGYVVTRIEQVSRDMSIARADMEMSGKQEADLSGVVERRKLELEVQREKRLSHDLLQERLSHLEASAKDKRDAIAAAEIRLKEIEIYRKQLAELCPELERLEIVRKRLEILEPRRKKHEEISRRIEGCRASLLGMQRMFREGEERLESLRADMAALEELRPGEKEHENLQARFLELEDLREKNHKLVGLLEGEKIRLASIESNLASTIKALEKLHQARVRLLEIRPLKDECDRLQEELQRQNLLQSKRKEIDELSARLSSLEGRKARLDQDVSSFSAELAALGDIEDQEEKLRGQDREMDRLATELNSALADLQGSLRVQELARAEALSNLKRVESLGAEGPCPTCERPVGEQRDLLLNKYRQSASEAENAAAEIQARIRAQREKIEGVTLSRSRLRKAFDDIQAKKSRRSELQASLRSAKAQGDEVADDIEEVFLRLEALGEVAFDPQRLAEIEEALKGLIFAQEECRSLEVRLEELPHKAAEYEALQKDRMHLTGKFEHLAREIASMAYSEDEYFQTKKRLSHLMPLHHRFLLLSRRVEDMPALEDRQVQRRGELERLSQDEESLLKAIADLGLDPEEHEALVKEQRSLVRAEEEAQKVGLRLAAEPEISKRRKESYEALAYLNEEIKAAKNQIDALGYSQEGHDRTRNFLEDAERELEAARKHVVEKKSRLAVLERDLALLKGDASRKEKHERELLDVVHRLEAVETTRGLVNRFMDQVLIRVKNQIVSTAGEILEEVSGKYSQLKIDDDFNILVEDGGEFYPISRYSGGEIDMIAVSVRVAISEYLMRFSESQGYSFLILDEVFGSQDLEHREKMINMLRSLQERFPQIIAISHISDVQGQFDNTIQVIEDEMGNSRAEVS